MDTFYGILGLIVIYALVHGTVIISKKIQGTSAYENVVLIAGAVFVGLTFLGIMIG